MARVWGGAEEQTRLLAVGLRDRGHQCGFVTRRNGKVADRMRGEGFDVLEVPKTGRSPFSIWRVRRHLRQSCPDVMHMVDPHAVTCGGLAAWGLGLPARVAVRHNPFPLRMASRYRWLTDRLICVCHAVADVCRRGGIPDSMLRVVPNGAAMSAASTADRAQVRRELGVSPHEPLILTVALLNACKGHRFLLDALPIILRQHPHTRLAFAGNGPLEEELRRQTRELALEDRVRFLGFRSDVRDLMRAADLTVLPSLVEGLSAVLLEAMFAACPLVATIAGGTPELLCHEQPPDEPAAWLVPPADAHALAAAVREALASPQQRAECARRARERAEARFTVDRLVENTLAVYGELLEGRERVRRPQAA
jgi:glycosyltransferase involved in cell wall biosynthesis